MPESTFEIEDNESSDGFVTEATERMHELDGKLREFVVERPITSVAIAAGVGFLLGRLIRRL